MNVQKPDQVKDPSQILTEQNQQGTKWRDNPVETKKTQSIDVTATSQQTKILQQEVNQQPVTKTPSLLTIGDTIKNRFILVKELGRGGMGVVYKARDLRKEEAKDRNPFIALKVLGDEFKKNQDSFIALQRETRKTQELAHPNIVTVYDFDKDGDHVFMTMECLDGKPLSVLLREQYFLDKPVEECWSIIKQIAMALSYAHKKNIIHLDLKPGNICVKKDGTVKVLDFGIARAMKHLDNTETAQDTTVFDAGSLGALTPPYASCEMLENQDPDYRDDIYALACVAYEILANRHPFNKIPATQARYNNIKPTVIDRISKKQCKAILHGLAFNRADRVPTIEQFMQEAQLLDSNQGSTAIVIPWKWLITGLSVIVLLVSSWEIYQYFVAPAYNQPIITTEKPPVKTVKKILNEQEQEKVSRLLEIAAMHALIGRRVEPKGTNALEAYNDVLEIDPQNQTALTAIKEIADYFEQQARQLWKQGDQKNSMIMLKKGLRASPRHPGLIALKKQWGVPGDTK